MSKSLVRREIHLQSRAHWSEVRDLLRHQEGPGPARAVWRIAKRIRALKNPPLVHKGRKP